MESALVLGETRGWRSADSDTQTIRLVFDEPQRVTRIALVFEEDETERTQEFVLLSSPDGGRSFREIVQQQWTFSRPNSIREVEDYRVDLSDVTVLELVIVSDINRGSARASRGILARSFFERFPGSEFFNSHACLNQPRGGSILAAITAPRFVSPDHSVPFPVL